MKNFDSLLIANRGEIAVRVIRTARRMGLGTIAIYSEADADAPHVTLADHAVCIGGSTAASSYLSVERVLQAARASGAGAIHPGYGFLSENASFARAVEDAGMVFVGPSPEAIALMGDKAVAKRRMIQAGVACVPGYEGEDQEDQTLIAEASRIGFPVMIKASAGGGGRGMRLVTSGADMPDALASARSEAVNAFGSGDLILEKAVQSPRHIEIQVFADQHGNVIHLGERDCSVQRRHQKVIEEAPYQHMTPALRDAMGQAAVEAARSIGYRGAGTVEFLLDREQNHYFLEMNTRLQVEHPVTEMVTGLDLVQWQLQIADGALLPMSQEDLVLNGHAIEVRLYAEDPANGFLPATGMVERWCPAVDASSASCRVRLDSGIAQGQQVTPFYDPMLAKLIAWGPDREQARQEMVTLLEQTEVSGVTTNRAFLVDVLQHDVFIATDVNTAFLDQSFDAPSVSEAEPDGGVLACAGLALFARARSDAVQSSLHVPPVLLNWSSAEPVTSNFQLGLGDAHWSIRVTPVGQHAYQVSIQRAEQDEETLLLTGCVLEADAITVLLGDENAGSTRRIAFRYAMLKGHRLHLSGKKVDRIFENLSRHDGGVSDDSAGGHVAAPMHGVVLEVLTSVGDTVTAGQKLGVMEAMKMQHDLRAGADGLVTAIHASVGDQVAEGRVVIEIEVAVEQAAGNGETS